MKLKISQVALSSVLDSVVGGLDGRGQTTLASVLFDAGPDVLTLTTTNGETFFRMNVPATGDMGRALLPGRKLFDIVRALPPVFMVELDVKDARGLLVSSSSRYQLACIPPEQFPDVPTPDTTQDVRIDAEMFRGVLRRTLYAIGELGSKFVLHGLYLEVSGSNFTAVGTDGHRLVIERWPISDSSVAWSGIVPRKR